MGANQQSKPIKVGGKQRNSYHFDQKKYQCKSQKQQMNNQTQEQMNNQTQEFNQQNKDWYKDQASFGPRRNRKLVKGESLNNNPNYLVGKIIAIFHDDKGQIPKYGTGCIISPTLVITAAHVICCKGKDDQMLDATQIFFFPSISNINNHNLTQNRIRVINNFYMKKFKQSKGKSHDIAFLQLSKTELLQQIEAIKPNYEFQDTYYMSPKVKINIVGYYTSKEIYQNIEKGDLRLYEQEQFTYQNITYQRYKITYRHTTSQGTSGAPIFYRNNQHQPYKLIGIHKGQIAGCNYGTLINVFQKQQRQLFTYELKQLIPKEWIDGITRIINFKSIVVDFDTKGFVGQDFDTKGNKQFGISKNNVQFRGGWPYYQPIKCKRYGIKVWDLYDGGNNAWLTNNNGSGQWVVAYHGVNCPQAKIGNGITVFNSIMNGREEGKMLIKGKKQSYRYQKSLNKNQLIGKGIYCTPDFFYALEYTSSSIEIRHTRYHLVLQCRVNPKKVKIARHQTSWVLNNSEDIRPYGIIMVQNTIKRNYPKSIQQFNQSFTYIKYKQQIDKTQN